MGVRWRFLVVGGGPAGSSAAIGLAREGHDVTLVEASRYDQPRVGELLSPEGQVTIQRLLPDRYKEFFLTHIGIVGAWNEAKLRRFSDPSWWALDRLGLDRALAEEARARGTHLVTGTRLTQLERKDGVWKYTVLGEEHEADWLLIATGRTGHVSKHLGAQIQKFDRQVSLVGFLEGSYESTDDMLIETTEMGWWYGAPIDKTRAVAAFLTDSDLDKGDPQVAWQARLDESIHAKIRFGNMKLMEKPSRVAAGFSLLVPSYGEGWAAVGEASSSFDPLSNLGLGRAAEMGEKMAEAFIRAARQGTAPDLLAFTERMGADFKIHSGILIDDYRKVHHFPQSVFWARRVAGSTGESPQRVKTKAGQPKKLIFPEGQLFECTMCGKCCRSAWNATIELPRMKAMSTAPETVNLAKKKCLMPLRVLDDGRLVTNVTSQGHCVFLEEEKSLCGLQDTGFKPKSCLQFPFMLRETPDGVVVGVSYLCNSVQRNEGRPLEEYADELQLLLADRPLAVVPRNVPVSWGRGVAWERYMQLEEFLLSGERRIDRIRALRWYLADWLQTPGATDFQLEGAYPREWLIELEGQMALFLVSQLEYAYFRTQQDLFDDLLDNKKVQLWKTRWKGRPQEVVAQYRVDYQTWLWEEIDRFLTSLIQRKFLLMQSPLYHNLLILGGLPRLLAFYTAVNAARREAREVEREDYYKALDWVELNVTAYTRQDSCAQTFFYWHMGLYKQENGNLPLASSGTSGL